MTRWLPFLMPVLGGLGLFGGGISWLSARRQRRADVASTEANAAKTLVEAAAELVEPLRGQIEDLQAARARDENRIQTLEKSLARALAEVEDVRAWAAALMQWGEEQSAVITSLGGTPIPMPAAPRRRIGD